MSPVRVLVVDQNRVFLQVLTRFLEEHPDVVVVAALQDARDALAQVAALRPDVVLVDPTMPDFPGPELIRRLRAASPDAGIVALMLLGTEVYRQAALAAGADALVLKPAVSTDLLPAIRRVVQDRRPPRPGGDV